MKRGSTYHLHKRVPRRYEGVEERKSIWVSLHTDSLTVAQQKAPIAWQHIVEGSRKPRERATSKTAFTNTSPVPSQTINLRRSLRFERKTKIAPEKGSRSNSACIIPARPSIPFRKSTGWLAR
ncbi:hypothetical protein RPE78_17470 (plasmid) [Thioclava litoralis]|uniref:DUF6538 domain-containing protein n=1 Tax=Thioclava litoralis TaxID=3076557 RepID=A0ABZ1E6Y4_9RHOB|nr:hypothetical protein RPE78_17470 [Thioclava sp. FTW29]